MKDRSLILFEQGVKSESTLKNYYDSLKRFKKFAKIESYELLIKQPVEKLQTLGEDYVIYLKENCHPNSLQILMLSQRFEYLSLIFLKLFPPNQRKHNSF